MIYVGGSGPGNYSRIQDAIDNASAGTTIFVYDESSPYYENILIDKAVTLFGENKETTIIDGSSSNHVISVIANEVTISDLTIQYGGTYWSDIGVYIIGTDVIVENNIIQHNTNGIFIEGASYNHLINNTICSNFYHGIRMEYTSNNHILDNRIFHNDDGIFMGESPNNLVVGNVLESNNLEGILIGENCDNNLIYHNNFIANKRENAYDHSNNSWDAGYPIGGNYWDDYSGEDLDQDGIGDTPYIIRGPLAIDHFPLMVPFGYETHAFDIEIRGGLGITLIIKDIRENSSDSLPIDVWLDYSYTLRQVLLPGMDPSVHVHLESNISNNQQIVFKSLPPYILGIGTLMVIIQVDTFIVTAEKQVVSWFVVPH